MSALEVPADLAAEATVVGCCVATEHGAAIAHGRLSERDFYRPLHAVVFSATRELVGVQDHDERLARAAYLAGVDYSVIADLVESRALQWDTNGTYAARVADTARSRRLMERLADGYNFIGAGGSVDEALALLQGVA